MSAVKLLLPAMPKRIRRALQQTVDDIDPVLGALELDQGGWEVRSNTVLSGFGYIEGGIEHWRIQNDEAPLKRDKQHLLVEKPFKSKEEALCEACRVFGPNGHTYYQLELVHEGAGDCADCLRASDKSPREARGESAAAERIAPERRQTAMPGHPRIESARSSLAALNALLLKSRAEGAAPPMDQIEKLVRTAHRMVQLDQGGWEVRRTPHGDSEKLGWAYASATGVEHWYIVKQLLDGRLTHGRIPDDHFSDTDTVLTLDEVRRRAAQVDHWYVVAVVSLPE